MQSNWFDPWYTQVSAMNILTILWVGFIVGFLLTALLENGRYKKVLRVLAKIAYLLIVLAETIVETVVELPARFNKNVKG